MKREFLALVVISLLMLLGTYSLYDNQKDYFNKVEASYSNQMTLNLDGTSSVEELSGLLEKYGYFEEKSECDFVAHFMDSIIKTNGRLPNLGVLNKYDNYIPESSIIAAADKCPSLSKRLEEVHKTLGLDDEARKMYESHTQLSGNGKGDVTITVVVENAKDCQDPLHGILVRLRKHSVDSVNNEVVETIAHQWTDSDGKVSFKVDKSSYYSIIPIKEGFQYGTPKGTRGGKPFVKDKTFTFNQRENKLRIFDGTTFRNMKEDNSMTVRTPSEYISTFISSIAVLLVVWWLAYFFMKFTDKFKRNKPISSVREPATDIVLLLILMALNCICVLVTFGISDPLKDMPIGVTMAMGSVWGVIAMCAMSSINFFKFFLGKSKTQFGFLNFDFIMQPLRWMDKKRKSHWFDNVPNGFGYLLIAVFLVIMLRLFGTAPEGSDAHVNLFFFQPSELSKYLIIIFIAAFFSKNAKRIQEFSTRIDLFVPQVKTVTFVALSIIVLMMMYLFLISDMGPALVILVTFILIYSVARRDLVQLVVGVATYLVLAMAAHYLAAPMGDTALAVVAKLLLPALWFLVWILYFWKVKKKIYESAIFLNLLFYIFSFADIVLNGLGISAGQRLANRMAMSGDGIWDNAVRGGDQIAQGIWGLASGGWFGQGLGRGNANFIPAFHTDMIFQSIGEILGFFAVLFIIACYFLLIYRSLLLARRAAHPFLFFTISGIALVTSVQFMVIVMGSLGIIPLTGVAVPFLSYGRASLIINLAAFGIVISMSRYVATNLQKKAIKAYDDVLTVGIISFLGISFCIVCVLFYYQKLRQSEFLVRPAAVADANGKRSYLYNPRISSLMRKMSMGNIYDRNGLLLATSNPKVLQENIDTLAFFGLDRHQLERVAKKHTPRYYTFDDHLFFMLGNYNTRLLWGNADNIVSPYGYFAEERHFTELRGFDSKGDKTEILYSDNYQQSPFLPGLKTQEKYVRRNYKHDIILKGLKYGADSKYIREWNNEENVKKRSISLTVDAVLQKSMQEALAEKACSLASTEGADSLYLRASVVVLDATHGDLLCSANWPMPSQNLLKSMSIINYKEKNGQKAFTDRDLGLTFQSPPGSTAKAVSAMAAYKKFGMKAKEISYIIDKTECIGLDKPGKYDIREGLRWSNNAFNVKLVNEDDRLYSQLSQIYYSVGIRVDVDPHMEGRASFNTPYFLYPDQPVTSPSDFDRVMKVNDRYAAKEYSKPKKRMSNHYFAMAWGQGNMMATPINMARAYSIIANHGSFVPTRYLLSDHPEPVSILESACATNIWENLVFTAHNHDNLTSFPTFGGKTGTPERIAKKSIFSSGNARNGTKNDSWYVFIVKSSHTGTNLAVAVRIERTNRTSGEARNWVRDMIMPILKENGYVSY